MPDPTSPSDPPSRLNAALEGRYIIDRKLGEGGMATVYLANDIRHDRKVALKLLKPELAAVVGAERFLAEIRTTANLQHPHILPLFDSGEADGLLFYVMPYVEGETLADRLARERELPVADAIRIASEVAEALEYAHDRGVIHRDIKPANVLLQTGRVLVADFGIALAVSSAGGARLTETGLSVGTPQYMSPEQTTGDRVLDGRSDLYSLGAVTYEMLTGQPPFTGATAQAILASVLTEQPKRVRELRDLVPHHIEGAVHTALQRKPADRFASLGDFKQALGDASIIHGFPPQGDDAPSRRARPSFVTLAAAAGLGAAAMWLMMSNSPPEQAGPTFLPLSTPPGVMPVDLKFQPTIAISPDGRKIAYVGSAPGLPLFLLDLDSGEDAERIAGTEGAAAPFFSPAGDWIGFGSGTSMKRVSLSGGVPTELADAAFFRGGSVSPDGETIYFGPRSSVGLSAMPAAGGDSEPITTPVGDGLDNEHFWPEALPDGRGLLFTSCCSAPRVMHLDLETGAVTPLVEGFYGRYSPTGHLVFMQPGDLLAAPFDPSTLELGEATVIAQDVYDGLDMNAEFAISTTGSFAYLSGPSTYQRTLVRYDRSDGRREQLVDEPRGFALDMRISPDGTRLAVPVGGLGHANINLFQLGRGDLDPLFTHEANDFWPIWSRDGARIAFTSVRNGPLDLFVVPADGSGGVELLFESENAKWPASWSADDQLLAFMQETPTTGFDIMIYHFADEQVTPFKTGPDNEGYPIISPDGNWIAYHADDSQQYEIYVEPFPGGGRRCKLSTNGGVEPRWPGDGTELFYRNGAAAMVVDVTNLDDCVTDPPQPVFVLDGLEAELWDIDPSRQFFITVDPLPTPQIRLVENWFEVLNQRVPR